MVNKVWPLVLAAVLLVGIVSGCKKEDKEADVVELLIGTWVQSDSIMYTDSTMAAVGTPLQLNLQEGGSYAKYQIVNDSTLTDDGTGNWNVNQAGTEVELTGYGTFVLVELSSTILVWEGDHTNGARYQATFNRN